MDFGYTRGSGLLDKKYREFFIPTVLTAMALSMSMSVDGIIVGNLLGSSALAAVNLVLPVVLFYNIFAVLLGMGPATVIAIAKGRREHAYADDVFTVSWALLLTVGLAIMALQIAFLEEISRLITTDAVLLPLVRELLQILVYGSPLMILCLGSVFCLRTDGKANLASAVLVTANMINLAMDLVYIGVFGMGVGGAALATVTGYTVGLVTLLFYVFAKDRTLHMKPALLSRPSAALKCAQRIFVSGAPGALTAVLVPARLLCVNTIVLAVAGSSGMVALAVCSGCLSLLIMFTYGAAQTMTPIVGALYGEKDFTGIRFVVKRSFQLLVSAAVIITLLLELLPENILVLFGVKDAADLEVGIPAIRIFALSLIARSLNFLMLYFYMSTEKRKIANAISVVEGFAVVVPAGFVLGHLFGIKGVWFAFVLAEVVTLAMIAVYYLYEKGRSAGRYQDILLLDSSGATDSKTLDLTIRSNIEDAVGLSEKTIRFLGEGGVEAGLCNKMGMVIEEMAVNIATYAHKRGGDRYYIDIRIKLMKEEFIVILRDDGEWFDPTKYLENERKETAYMIGGIELVGALASKVEYSRVLGLNNTAITIQR
jgi:Na+-driven multidrug efflux pump/anti-sigma regulatory factor (Ser/Thr protein kinase)